MPHDNTRSGVGPGWATPALAPGRPLPLWAAAFGVVLGLSGCQRVGIAAPVAPPAVAACPAPSVETEAWVPVSDSAGVTYRLPPGFAPRSGDDATFREWRSQGALSGRVMIGFSPSRDHYTTLRRVPSPPMRQMTECVDDVGGFPVLFQAWRTEGGRFTDGERSDLYEVLALIPVEPMLTLFVTGGGADPAFQRVLLTIARTVRVDPR